MNVTVRLVGGIDDDLRSLRAWLVEEDELRGHVEMVEQPPAPGRLGPGIDVLLVALAPGGAATALVAGLISWIRSRHGDIDVTGERDGDRTTIHVSARRVRGLDADGLKDEITQLVRALEETAARANGDRALPPSAENDSGETDTSAADRTQPASS